MLPGARIGAANLAEVITGLVDRGVDPGPVVAHIAELDLELVPPGRSQAEAAGPSRATTRTAGPSSDDGCCLTLSHRPDAVAVPTDRAWADLDGTGVKVEVGRQVGAAGTGPCRRSLPQPGETAKRGAIGGDRSGRSRPRTASAASWAAPSGPEPAGSQRTAGDRRRRPSAARRALILGRAATPPPGER